ncbi:PhnD/SsuA/transferrin family substrate-binding protein [candidate division KSB1 bacterium]|nr:PhnD/SsuA/transferrin family substrate-binding protein [bacterium]NUM66595.1 PhnD/SsuA/transferrin family substrate-binding protein [candidate division KSB1 bacterium]
MTRLNPRPNLRWRRAPLLLPAGLLAIAALTALFYLIVMDFAREFPPAQANTVDSLALKKPVVHIGVISRYRPRILYRGYQPIMDYLTANTPYRFELLLSQDYNEALQHLITRRASAVFLGSYLYVKAHAKYGVIPVLKPLNENFAPVSRSVLIAHPQAAIVSLPDLRGKKLALPARESFSSHWLLDYELARHGLSSRDLAQVHNFPHHHTVIAQVLNGNFDAGVTREYLVKDLIGHGVHAVLYSDPIPSSPIAVAADYDRELIAAMKTALLAVNQEEHRRKGTTRNWDGEFVNGFVEASDADYAAVAAIVAADTTRLESR